MKPTVMREFRNPNALLLAAREQNWRLVLTPDEGELQAYRPGKHGKLLAVAPVSVGMIDSFIAYKAATKPKRGPGRPRRIKAPAGATLHSIAVPFDAKAVLAEVAEREAA